MKKIINYVLYGEEEHELFTNYLHIENIKVRSEIHGWKFRPHQHHNLQQFFYIEEGGGHVLIEDTEYPIYSNSIIVIPSLTIHGFNFLLETKGWVLTIPDLYLQKAFKDEPTIIEEISKKALFNCTDKAFQQEFKFILSLMEKEHVKATAIHSLNLRCLATLLITKIIHVNPDTHKIPKQTISKKQFIFQNFRGLVNENFKTRLSVTDYSSLLNITPTHLNRICRNTLDVSASDLIHERTLIEAKRLLLYTSMTISEISYELGYIDPAHFSKFFHRKITQTPSDFRKHLATKQV
ncbi:MAG: helix-turn-helix domain-containing protein [Colwellia sp.]|nr:helix-turn-helix domain-containing protein [Colwellia sp.]